MTHQTVTAHKSAESGAALVPIVFGSLLTLLWGAYALFYVYEMILLGAP